MLQTSDLDRKRLAVHIIPYDGIGGVETAAKSLADGVYDDIEFTKLYLCDKSGGSAGNPYTSENDPRAYWAALRKLWTSKPDVVVASLWRSCALLIALKLLRPQTRAVTFLHSTVDKHFLDRILSRIAICLSFEIWTDSQATLSARVPIGFRRRACVISYLVHRLQARADFVVKPRFVFWGRLHPQKGLLRALQLFARVQAAEPGAVFDIIGPDGGERSALDAEVARLHLQACVRFHGPLAQDDIFRLASDCAFYLQTSKNEGMAMSVVEAMQLGLVPIVTPMGEIGRYCVHDKNALVVESDKAAVDDVVALLGDEQRYRALSQAAVATWAGKQLYAESVLAACRQLLANEKEQSY